MGEIGKITPVKAYQTTDGVKFVGENAKERAEDHQRWLDSNKRNIDALMVNVEENKEWPMTPTGLDKDKNVVIIKKEDLPKIRKPVPKKPSQVFKSKKGKGSYERKPKHPKKKQPT